MTRRKLLAAALGAVGMAGGDASAVRLDGDGVGQALIYPYYTVQSSGTDVWNTYLSVVNRTEDAKALRMRFREGRNGREVAGFNLFLDAHDTWTAAVVSVDGAGTSGAKLLTADVSCSNPVIPVQGIVFSTASFTGAQADGLGIFADRTREGYVEIIEMATLTGATAAAVTHNSAGMPANCGLVRATAPLPAATLKPPAGGLSGTLTLINVNSGMDMGVNAVALSDLATAPFYRNYDDPYPDFNAAEVAPVSYMSADGVSYVLKWSRGVDAVSSVLMSTGVINEYVRDTATASQTDWVLTFPTKRFYATDEPPFAAPSPNSLDAGTVWFNREEKGPPGAACDFGLCPPSPAFMTAAVLPALPSLSDVAASPVLGSKNMVTNMPGIVPTFQSGWAFAWFDPAHFGMASLASSVAQVHVSGASTTSRFRVAGLPVVGLMVRTFNNGTLQCGAYPAPGTKACQGNYGGVFPHRYRRSIEPLASVP
jgi:hypothetical protein